MSEIRDPAQTTSPTASGDEGQPGQSTESTATTSAAVVQPSHEPDDGPSPGNELPAGAAAAHQADDEEEDESPEDSIGNRIDAPGQGNARPPQAATPAGEAAKKKRRKKKNRQGDGPNQGETAQADGNHQGHRGEDPNRRAFKVGDKVRAKIVSVGAAACLVDLWGKENAVLDLREVVTAEVPAARVGDGVDVVVLQDGARGGNVVVTRDPNRAERAREMVAQAFNSKENIEGLITGVNRGGLEVDLSGVRGFCPSSQIDVRFPPTINPKSLVLTRQVFRVTSLSEGGREAIVSRRAILEGELRARAEEAKERIQIGSTVKGIVIAVKDYGVFVDLNGIEGMIHVSELTHNRSARPSDVVKVGEEIEAKVLRISGGQQPKDAPKPAEPAADSGEAAEAALAEAIAAEEDSGEHPEAAEAAEGEAAEKPGKDAAGKGKQEPKDRDKDRRKRQQQESVSLPRIILSRRAIEPDPWTGVEKRFSNGSVHVGRVARMQPFGAFVELSPGVDGLLHVSELGDGTRRIEHPNEVLKENQNVTVRVERVDRGVRRISLSLLPDGVTEDQLKTAVIPRMGMVTKAQITEHDAAGVWAQIVGAIGKFGRGLITPPESNQPKGTDLRRALPVGTEVQVKVIELDRGRPKLSIRAALHDEERQAYRAYQREATSKTVGVSLADKLRLKLGNLTVPKNE